MKIIIETIYNRMGTPLRIEVYLENEEGKFCLLKKFESHYDSHQALFYAQEVQNVLPCKIETCSAVVKR